MTSNQVSDNPVDDTPRLLLIGMMASGKSTVGRALAARTGWPYLDNDDLVRRLTGRATAEVLASHGERALRSAEAAALDEALAAEPPVIAGVAAGVVADPGARRRMQRAFVVYLRAPVTVLADRVGSGEGRPWLGADPLAALERLYEDREPLYREVADLTLDVAGVAPADLVGRIVEALGAAGP